ncbi:MAG: TRAM domain-containing protein [Haloferacaceae archaeon]
MLSPDQILCLFSARVDEREDSYVVEVPKGEIDRGAVQSDGVYRVGLFPAATPADDGNAASSSDATATPPSTGRTDSRSTSRDAAPDEPPVSEGEVRPVEIEDLGDQGDGLARIGPGYVVFVPDTDVGDRVRVRVTDVRENFAFAEVVA